MSILISKAIFLSDEISDLVLISVALNGQHEEFRSHFNVNIITYSVDQSVTISMNNIFVESHDTLEPFPSCF